ncbi:MAG TPA: VWA domain-containing protein [Pyrinomonadaceae bacterium]
MSPRQNLLWLASALLSICLSSVISSQTLSEQKPNDDVIRTNTELVQTDVMVFDKQGHFVNGLTRDNFEIKIDGQTRPIQFFEQIKAGAGNEEAQLAAARGVTQSGASPVKVVPLDRGRTIFFFLDDFHLDLQGFAASRKIISNFIDKEMGQNDQAAIASATGQIGFLQQLTDDRAVLQAALDRVKIRTYPVTDIENPQMSEYEAMLIDNNDIDVFEYFVKETMRLNGNQMNREMAASMVNGRAHRLLAQAANFNANTLSSLEHLIQLAKNVPGRKVLFLLSDGFLIQNRRGDALPRIQRITSAAAKSSVVIYAVDAHGLAPLKGDASSAGNFDPAGILNRAAAGEQTATQDGLNALSRDTGGKPIFNTNDFRPGLRGALEETAIYYLLAWKPDAENKKPGRFRNIQVNVIGRPDLAVRMRKGFFDVEPPPAATTAELKKLTPVASPDDDNKKVVAKLRETIFAPYPVRNVPLSLGLNYYDGPGKGPILAASVQIPGEFLFYGPRNGKNQAVVDVTGIFFDDKGQIKANFYERLVSTASTDQQNQTYEGDITYTYPASVPPGLYQVRVAVRDDQSGKAGSIHGWLEVPDLTKGQLSMSSLLLGERGSSATTNVSNDNDPTPVVLNASHRFRQGSSLRFLAFSYNTKFSDTAKDSDLAVQVQVIRDDQPVMTTALRRITTEGIADPARVPYAAEIPLTGLQPGRYVLQVTFIDRLSKQSTSRQTHFDIF